MDQSPRKPCNSATTSVAVASVLLVCGISPAAVAEEPRLASEPYLLAEPAEVTQVVDAFDAGNPFDLRLSVGYQYSRHTADILRETNDPRDAGTMAVGRYAETTHRLNTRADIGLYHDIALVIRMPVILANDRSLNRAVDDPQATSSTLYDSQPLFALPFRAPTRSGIEYLALGLDFGIMNQYRDSSKPTWVFGFEGRFDVSTAMHACNADPSTGRLSCADPGDVNQNGRYDPELRDSLGTISLESATIAGRKAGVSRGTTGLEIHTYASKRIKYIEPYGGVRFLAEFPKAKSDYGALDLEASLVNRPPLEGSVIIGMAVIPWEHRSAYQRATLDFRFSTTYRSEGRDYSELFDALGSSQAMSLRVPAWTGYQAGANGTSVIDPASRRVYFTGLTDVQQHMKNRLSAEFTFQAGKYLKFGAGLGYLMIQSHNVTYDQACNANITNRPEASGPCRKEGTSTSTLPFGVTGLPNPNYRQPINVVGRRFLVSDSNLLDLWLNASVMF